MSQYNPEIKQKVEDFLKSENLSQAKAAPMMGVSQGVLSMYRREEYPGDVEAVEKKLSEFFKLREEKRENLERAEKIIGDTSTGYLKTSISESAYKAIRYCQLEKGIVVIDGDAGIGKTKAAAQFCHDNPNTTVYVRVSPSTSSPRSLLKLIARTLNISHNLRTEELSQAIQERLRRTDTVIIIDEAQNLKFMALEEIRGWVDEDFTTGKPGVGIVLIGNVEVYNRMLGRQEATFAQQFSRTRLHSRFKTQDIKRSDVELFFPVLKENNQNKELDFLTVIGHSKWGIRGMVNVFNNAVNAEDISLEGLEAIADSMGILWGAA